MTGVKIYAYFGKLVKGEADGDPLKLQTRCIKEVVYLKDSGNTVAGVAPYVIADDGKSIIPAGTIKDFMYITTESPRDGRA